MTQPPAGPGIDLMSGEFFGSSPFAAYAWLREHRPVYHDELNDLWALTRYDDVKAGSTDTAVFSNAGGIRPKFPPLPMMIAHPRVAADPHRWRRDDPARAVRRHAGAA